MRIALGGVTLTVLVLFYLGVYRPTRSSFSGWWVVSLLCAGASTTLLLLNGTEMQVTANPASTVLAAVGATCVWFATRSLRHRRLPLWLLAVAPAAMLVLVVLQDPANNIWAGNSLLFVYMGVLFGAGAIEMWLAWWARWSSREEELNGEAVVALFVSAIASSALASFYLFRAVLFLAVGPESTTFTGLVGTASTTAILLICLVAVTFSVSAVGWDQQTQEFRRRAMLDDLTGLLGRTEFHVQAQRAFAMVRDTRAFLVVADLDHFKAVNDARGHAAGDGALMAFAEEVTRALAPGEIAGRLGGEEFGLVLFESDADRATGRLQDLSRAFANQSHTMDFPMPTVSYGMTSTSTSDTVADAFDRADMALYRAKSDGRNRSVLYTAQVGRESGRTIGLRSTD